MGRKGKKKSSGSSRKGKKHGQAKQSDACTSSRADVDPKSRLSDHYITDDDLEGMKQWIESLTFAKLMESLEFGFCIDFDQDQGSSPQSPRRQDHKDEMPTSQDFDLLMKMTSLQCNNSKLHNIGIEDECYHWNDPHGRYDERRYHKQLQKMRLFRLVNPELESKNNPTNSTQCESQPKRKPLHEDVPEIPQLATDLPAELMDILSQAGVKRSTSDLLETFNELDELDKAFEPIDVMQETESNPFIRYKVETDEAVADDGAVLGRGSTSEQRTADELLLRGTVLTTESQSLASDSNTEQSCSKLPRCKLHAGYFPTSSSNQKRALLDLLRITSRGNFLSVQGARDHSYWAPWFGPLNRWFSLPMYLASRYESALWEAYFNRSNSDETKKSVNSLLQSVDNLDRESIGNVICYAFGEAVKEEMIKSRQLQESGSFGMTMVLEYLLRNLIKYKNDCDEGETIHTRLEYLSVSPLLKWDTPYVQLKTHIMKFISHGLSHEAEKSLMQSLSVEDNEATMNKIRKPIRKRRLSHHQPEILSTLKEAQSEEEQESDEDDPFVESILPNTASVATNEPKRSNSPSNNSSTIEKIIVLQVIDDILTTVFKRHGIMEDAADDFIDAVLVKSRSDSYQGEVRGNDDDIEVATTAIASNKAGASLDAAIFLKHNDTDNPSHSHSPKRSQQLWASRTRREHQEPLQDLGLKRCLSQGTQAVNTELSNPQSTSKLHRSHNRSSSLGYSPSMGDAYTEHLEIEDEVSRKQHDSENPAPPKTISIALNQLSRLSHSGPIFIEDEQQCAATTQLQQRPGLPPTPLAPTKSSSIAPSLSDVEKRSADAPVDTENERINVPQSVSLSVSSPPKIAKQGVMTTSHSRDDLRSIDERFKLPRRNRDDHHTMGRRQVDALLSYRNAVAQSSVPRNPASVKSHDAKQKQREDAVPRKARSVKSTRSGMWIPGEFPSLSSSAISINSYREPMINKILHLDLACARSESALDADGAEDASHCNVIPPQNDETMTKDGATTISSVRSTSSVEADRFASSLKEERNSYRDMCLTLGAENAKLRNLLASKMCAPLHHPPQFAPDSPTYFPHSNSYDHHQRAPSYHQYMSVYNGNPNFTTQSIVAMSDAGLHRGDYDFSVMSEDGTDVHPSIVGNSTSRQLRSDSVHSFSRRTSVGGTYADSDASFDQNAGGPSLHRIQYQDSFFGPIPLHGMQSRLSKDIDCYMQSLKTQLKKNEHRRTFAVNQITKAVKALWPRAQIKMYGSHVTKLCLPSSDMDFVICLPAVHKNAPARAPGDLEGRNAINETNQKILARKLKGENWLGTSRKAQTITSFCYFLRSP